MKPISDKNTGMRTGVLRVPDSYSVYLDGKIIKKRPGESPRDIFVRFEEDAETGDLSVVLHATNIDLYHLRLRWNFSADEMLSAENGFSSVRVYGEAGKDGSCHFRGVDPNRLMPWFFTATSGSDAAKCNSDRTSVCYGVTSPAAAHCAWQLDHLGVTLWLDLRSGRMPLMLNGRGVRVATVRRSCFKDMSAFDATKAFCSELFPDKSPCKRIFGTRLPLCSHDNTLESVQNKVRDNAMSLDTVSKQLGKSVYLMLDTCIDFSDVDLHKLAETISGYDVIPAILYHPKFDEEIRLIKSASGKNLPDISFPKITAAICQKIRSIARMGFRMIALDYDDFDIFGACSSFAETMYIPRDDEKLIYRHHTSAEIINSFFEAIRAAITSEEEIFGYKIPLFVFGAVPHLCSAADYMTVMPNGGNGRFIEALQDSVISLIPSLIKGGHACGYTAYMPQMTSSSVRKMSHPIMTHLSKSGLSFFITYDADINSGTQSHYLKEYFKNAANPPETVYPIDFTENRLPVTWKRGKKSITLKFFGRDGYEYYGSWNI